MTEPTKATDVINVKSWRSDAKLLAEQMELVNAMAKFTTAIQCQEDAVETVTNLLDALEAWSHHLQAARQEISLNLEHAKRKFIIGRVQHEVFQDQ